MVKNIKSIQPDFLATDGESKLWRKSSFAAGVEVKDLGAADGRAMQLVKFHPGTVFPRHTHQGPEFIYILEGDLIQNGEILSHGWSAISAAGTIDEEVRSETGCLFLIIYTE